MFGLIKECAEEYQQVLLKSVQSGEPFDAKDYSVNYTVEVISSTAFGLKTHSITSDTEFKKMSRRIFQLNFTRTLKFVIRDWFPFLARFLPLKFFDEQITDFFFKTVRETVAYRKQNQFSRNDFLQILMNLNEMSTKSHEGGTQKEEELGTYENNRRSPCCHPPLPPSI